MSIVKEIHSHPAYTIVELETATDSTCVPEVSADKNVRVRFGSFRDGSPRFDEVSFGSVVSYARQYNEDPIAAVDECRKDMERNPYAGHKLHWANKCAVSITSHAKAHACFIGLNLGDVVRFEGLLFRLELAPNDNVALVEV